MSTDTFEKVGSNVPMALKRLSFAVLMAVLLLVSQPPRFSNASQSLLVQATDEPTVTDSPEAESTATPTRIPPTHAPTWTPSPDMPQQTAVIRLSTAEARPINQRYFLTATAMANGATLRGRPFRNTLRDVNNGQIAYNYGDGKVKNAIISVRFYNAEKLLGVYGIMFRDEHENKQYRLYIDYLGSWNFGYGTAKYTGGSLARLDRRPGGFNDLLLIVKDDVALFFLNGDYIARLNVGRVKKAGDVSVFAGMYRGQKASNQETYYDRFTVWELPD